MVEGTGDLFPECFRDSKRSRSPHTTAQIKSPAEPDLVEVTGDLFPENLRDSKRSHSPHTSAQIKSPDEPDLVEVTGVEPVTFCMPCKRSSQLS